MCFHLKLAGSQAHINEPRDSVYLRRGPVVFHMSGSGAKLLLICAMVRRSMIRGCLVRNQGGSMNDVARGRGQTEQKRRVT
jgi:hypothetical protein